MMTRVTWRDYSWTKDGRRLLHVPFLEFEGPGLVLVVGPTGSGKTTLLRSLTGDLEALAGGTVEGQTEWTTEPPAPSPRLGYLPQAPLDGFLAFDAESELALREQTLGVPRRRAEADARERTVRLGLSDRGRVHATDLSGGERKRVALAALQVGSPAALLLDEPLNHLDPSWKERILAAIQRAAQTSLVLVVTHDWAALLPHARRVVELRSGEVAYDGRSDTWPHASRAPGTPRPAPPPASGPPEPVVSLRGAAFRIDGRLLVRIGQLDLGRGLHALVGPNGSGKTTLLRTLAGLHAPPPGTIRVLGQDPAQKGPAAMSRLAAYHPEEPVHLFFKPTVAEELQLSALQAAETGCDVAARVREAAFDFELDQHLGRHPWSLSGGERERLALACVDAARTPLVLLDEPTHGLDAAGRARLHAFLQRAAQRACVIVATHDAELVASAGRVHEIRAGTVTSDASPVYGVVQAAAAGGRVGRGD